VRQICWTRFRTQEQGIGAVSLKMVKPQLEEDKVVDLIITTLLATPVLDLAFSSTSFFPFSLFFFSNKS
jgi:hypothetical protein